MGSVDFKFQIVNLRNHNFVKNGKLFNTLAYFSKFRLHISSYSEKWKLSVSFSALKLYSCCFVLELGFLKIIKETSEFRMESSTEGRRKSVRLMNQQVPIASTSTAKMNDAKGKKKVLENKVVASSSSGGDLTMEVDSNALDFCASGEKAMGISLILQCMVSKLNVPNLKSARLVNKEWKAETDKEITRRGCFRLKFKPKTRPLKEGLKELEFSKDLPCFDFHFSGELGIKMEKVEKFLSLFGSQVKLLTLNSEMNGKTLSALLVGIPNLENLFVTPEFTEGTQSASKLTLPRGSLSNLKHITFVDNEQEETLEISAGSSLLQIISKAPNLQSINNAIFEQNLLLHDPSKWNEKVHLLKSFRFQDDDVDIYGKSGIKVENLFLRFDDCKKELIRNITKSSQDTLTTLVTISTFICLPKKGGFGPLFLPFQNLKVLQIWVDEKEDFVSENLSQFGQDTFPNLTTVVFELHAKSRYLGEPDEDESEGEDGNEEELEVVVEDEDEEYSPGTSIESVVNLELRGQKRGLEYWQVGKHWMQRIKELFPNVKHLKLKDSFKIPRILPLCIAEWPELESLEFHVNFLRPDDMREPSAKSYFEAMKLYQNLDAAFTGLPLKMCQGLRNAKPGEILEEDFQEALDINSEKRSRNSLVFLKELKKLNIVFSDIRSGISETDCPISPVSFLYAFKLMPNLKVTLLYDQNLAKFNSKTRTFEDQYNMEEYLEELAPHCEIGHWESGGVASLISPQFRRGFPRIQLSGNWSADYY